MDADNTQWLVKQNNKESVGRAYKWSGNRTDLIHSPEWLRALVNDWEFDEYTSFKHSVTLFYEDENRAKSITANPGDFILRVGDRLIVLSDAAFIAIFMEKDPTVSEEK